MMIGGALAGGRQNVAGGSAGAGGYSYQAEASAAVAAKMLAGESLNWAATGCRRIPVAILSETGTGGDDLRIDLESGAVVEVQAKKGVQKGEKLWAALADLALAVESSPNVYGVLLTDTNASQTVRSDLKRDLIRLGQGRSDDLRSITKEFLRRLDKAKVKDAAGCCARLRIFVCEFGPESTGEDLIRSTLARVVYDPGRVADAHAALYKDGLNLIEGRGRRDRRSVEDVLSAHGIAVTAAASGIPHEVQALMSQFNTFTASMANLSVEGAQAKEKLLIADTHALLGKLQSAWNSRDFREASAGAAELRRWLSTHADQLPGGSAAEAYALLVEVESSRPLPQEAAHTPEDLAELIRAGERALNRSDAGRDGPVAQRLFSLRAFVTSLAHGADAGLEMLTGRDDPYAIRRRLAILIRAGRFDEAAAAATDSTLHAEWAEKAAVAFAATERYAEAHKVIRWAKAQVAIPQLAILCATAASDAACEGVLELGQRELENAFEPVTPDSAERLRHARTLLTEITEATKTLQQVRFESEMRALHREAAILARLSDREALGPVISSLESWKPLPLVLPHLVQRGLWPCGPDWPERMRREYPGDFEVEVLASLITPGTPERHQEEFDRLYELAQRAPEQDLDPAKRRAIYARLEELASGLGGGTPNRLAAVEAELLGSDERARQTMSLVRLVHGRQFDAAAAILEQVEDEDDHVRLQCRAAVALHRGRPDEALGHLRRALTQVSHPGLLRRTAEVAVQAGMPAEAVPLLERYLERRPEDDSARQEVAQHYVQRQDFAAAAGHFEALWKRVPHEVRHAVNYAASLAHAGDLEHSLGVYDKVCGGGSPHLQAVIARSSVLKALGKPKAAFDTLIAFRDRWWDDPQYLMAVSDLGYAAQQERTAFEALARVQALQAEGKADADLVRTFSVDAAVEMFVEHRQKTEDVQGYVLRGQLPWLCVDRILNLTAMDAWAQRTRPLPWVGEIPFAQATTAVYATNSFFIDRRAAAERGRAFRSLPNPQANAPVVADQSALLTLHGLGLLDKAADFFGQILAPSAYMPVALEEAGKLVLHQPSQKAEQEAIRDAMDLGRLSVVAGLDAGQARVTELSDSEWDEDAAPFTYGLSDVLRLLRERGLITDQQMLDNAHLMRRTSVAQSPLRFGQRLAVNLAALKLLAGADLLEPLSEAFHAVITEHDRDAVNASLRAYRQQEEMYASHRRLWERIRSDERFTLVPYSPRERTAGEEGDPRREVDIAAALLAQERGLPLLADDRACQSFIYADPQSPSGCYAFGTDRLLTAWSESGMLAPEKAADYYLRLVRWRYRFLVPPAELLKIFALRHISRPPGKELREMANYVHDCMRDAGLPLEQASEMPTSALANWVFLQWIQTVVEFACLLWTDETVATDRARACTDWAIRHMLPSPPRAMGAAGGLFLTALPRHVLSHALIRLVEVKDTARGRDALEAISEALGVPKDRYTRTVAEAMSGI
jgi:tetratricopeptide (TPR) repeat protein